MHDLKKSLLKSKGEYSKHNILTIRGISLFIYTIHGEDFIAEITVEFCDRETERHSVVINCPFISRMY